MRIYTLDSLHYPIKITRLLRQPGDNVLPGEALFDYEYQSIVEESLVEDKEKLIRVTKTLQSTFQSYAEGSLTKWLLVSGTVVTKSQSVVRN